MANQSETKFFRLKKWEKEVELIKQKKALYDLELDSKATFADYPLSAQGRIIHKIRATVYLRLRTSADASAVSRKVDTY